MHDTTDWEKVKAEDFIHDDKDENQELLKLLSELDEMYKINSDKLGR